MERMRRHLSQLLMLALILTSVVGCIHSPGGLAPSTIPLEGRRYRVIGDVTQTDNAIRVLGLIPVTGSNTTQGAIDDALGEKHADALLGVTVEFYTQWWILFTRHATMVHGQAVKFESPPKIPNIPGPNPGL